MSSKLSCAIPLLITAAWPSKTHQTQEIGRGQRAACRNGGELGNGLVQPVVGLALLVVKSTGMTVVLRAEAGTAPPSVLVAASTGSSRARRVSRLRAPTTSRLPSAKLLCHVARFFVPRGRKRGFSTARSEENVDDRAP